MAYLETADPDVAGLIGREGRRQLETIELIASENYAPPAVREAQGSLLTDKNAEGYPGRRYYGGCEVVDAVEELARERARALFGAGMEGRHAAEHVNVQPHSGVNANLAVYLALMEPGDSVLALALNQGGHLSHGHQVSAAGRVWRFFHYGVRRTDERLDYEQIRELALRRRPRLIIAGYTAYPRVIDYARFRRIAREAGAYLMVDMAHTAGLVAADVFPSPMPHADVVTATTYKTLRGARGGVIMCRRELARRIDRAVFPGLQGTPHQHTIAAKAVTFKLAATPEFRAYARRVVENARVLATALAERGMRIVAGGTDSHLVLVDLRPLGCTGREAEEALEAVGIAANKNQVPYDEAPPAVAGGVRLGSAAMTTRSFGPREFRETAELIHLALARRNEPAALGEVRRGALGLCRRFPLPW